ncbi:MAG: phytoene desaturase [Deltaproteobacteria bacterium]|nr:phytoene desaturase [Deltaproteobacteria bacterium]
MHVVVVGAGPGGLAAAINLAGSGVTVTVVEKEDRPGGRMRGLAFSDYAVDTGPSILQLPALYESLFARAGKRLGDYVTLMPVDPNTRVHFWDGTFLDTYRDGEKTAQAMAKFGADKPDAMRRWLRESKDKYLVAYEKFIATPADSLAYYAPWRLWPTLRFRPWQTLYGHLDGFFHDDRISYALAYPSKYLGLHPTNCSSVFSVIPFIEQAFGVWHVKGGFRELAQGMRRCAEDLGATFRFNSTVAKVDTSGGVAHSVRLSTGEVIACDAVVINADLAYAATTLIDAAAREGSNISDRALNDAAYSCSTFMFYLGLDRRYEGLPHHQIYLSAGARRTDKDAIADRVLDAEDPSYYVCCPQATEPTGAPAGHSTLYVLIPTPNTQEPIDWTAAKAALRRKLPAMLARLGYEDIERHIRAEQTHSALTWRDDYNVFRGAVFNLSHTWAQLGPMRPKVKSPTIKDLYWVGGGTHPGSGLLTIIESANIAAHHILGGQLKNWPQVPGADALRP